MARKWQKTAIFSCNFDLFLAFFIDCDHIYVPKGTNWGSTSRPHIGDLVMSLFLLWCPPCMTGDGPKMVHFGPKLAKHGRLAPDSTKASGKALIGHITSKCIGKHVLGSFSSLATPINGKKKLKTGPFLTKKSQAWQPCS